MPVRTDKPSEMFRVKASHGKAEFRETPCFSGDAEEQGVTV